MSDPNIIYPDISASYLRLAQFSHRQRLPISSTITSNTIIGDLEHLPIFSDHVKLIVNGLVHTVYDSPPVFGVTLQSVVWYPAVSYKLESTDDVIAEYFSYFS